MSDERARDARFAEIDQLLDGPEPDEAAWYAENVGLLEEAYLAAGDAYGQSGMRADAARWERGRRPIVSAVDRDGTFLDVGCANGLLMQSVRAWVGEAGHDVEPYGLDLSPRLAELARRRLPAWAERIFVGNVIDWVGPMRFDFVRTELVYVPSRRRAGLVGRLLREVVAPGGRLIVCSSGSSRPGRPGAEAVREQLRGWGYEVPGEADGTDDDGVVIVRVAWVDPPSAG